MFGNGRNGNLGGYRYIVYRSPGSGEANIMFRKMLIITLAILAGVIFLSQKPEPQAIPVYIHTVQNGETLWDIARQYPGDPRKTVYEIREMNDLESAIIYPGQKLIVRRCEK